MKLVKVKKDSILMLHQEEPNIHPVVVWKFQTCNNAEHNEDILFEETKNFPIIQEERLTQSPVVLRSVYKPTKKSVWFNKPKESLLA